MANELAVYEAAFEPMLPRYEALLAPTGLPVQRLMETVYISLTNNPKLMRCTLPSIIATATTFAVLGLEADGVTGQAYMIMFKDKAQPAIGYKGYNTIAWRSSWTIQSKIVREADKFDYRLGTDASIDHVPSLKDSRSPIIAAYAIAQPPGSAKPIISVMPISDINAIRDNSPGFKFAGDSPWRNPNFYPAMCAKTVHRQVARSIPIIGVGRAAALESMHEDRGRLAYLKPDGDLEHQQIGVIDGSATEVTDADRPIKPEFKVMMSDGNEREFNDITAWSTLWMSPTGIIERLRSKPHSLARYRELNGAIMASLAAAGFANEVMTVQDALRKAIGDPEENQP